MAEQIRAALDDEETETVARVPVRYLLILVKNPAKHLFGNADPRVFDLDGEIVTTAATSDKDTPRFRVLDRVSDQVVKDAAEKFRVRKNLASTGHDLKPEAFSVGF